ncbi:hypothetical protein E4U17_007133 [Claviceps sp. LM77 group G4]|nr:hypothetical protein E4U33_001665 [Claviceps sp. LM78 group G4]KAG6048481.1 hypothetical protein E4U17_007133 [Claviceps sp. LM77 group G4]
MSAPTRIATSRIRPPRLATTGRYFTASRSPSQDLQWPQRTPLGEYYTIILRNPILLHGHARKPEKPLPISDPSAPSDAPSKADDAVTQIPKASSSSARENITATPIAASSTPSAQELTPQEKTRIIFGSRPRLLGPADQADKLAQKEAQSMYVAGVLVPPKPEEPENCCMSGCINCVWDRFREDMEEWTAKKHEAQAAADGGSGTDGTFVTSGPVMGKDETIAEDAWDDEMYRGVPVGIREFMKQEKRLKEKHAREGTAGG